MGTEKAVKRFLIVLLCLLLGTSACLYQYGYEMKISEAELQQKINAKLPFSKNYYALFKVTLEEADVKLMQDRVRIQFDARLEPLNPNSLLNRLLHRTKQSLISGSVDITASPEYQPETGQVFLSDVKVLKLDIKGVRDSQKFEQSVQNLVTDYLATHPVYTLRENNLTKMFAKSFLKSVTVRDQMLKIHFGA